MAAKYTPRSGAIRKIKYPLRIFREEEFRRADLHDVLNIAKEMADDAEKVGVREIDDRCKRKKVEKKGSGLIEITNIPASTKQNENFDESDNAKVPDHIYDKLYPAKVKLPKFPVKSGAGKEYTKISKFEDDTSDYDMDSEDEEWLQQHPEYNITPNRLEYIFTQLNKRNTHVVGKAITAFRPPYRGDFSRVFPYWKEKRYHNRNVSTFKPKINCSGKEVRNFGKDPYIVFLSNPDRPLRDEKVTRASKETKSSCLASIAEKRKMLKEFREMALSEIKNAENLRHGILKSIQEMNERYQTIKNDNLEDDSEIDQNNNETSEFPEYPNAYHTSSRTRTGNETLSSSFTNKPVHLSALSTLSQNIPPNIFSHTVTSSPSHDRPGSPASKKRWKFERFLNLQSSPTLCSTQTKGQMTKENEPDELLPISDLNLLQMFPQKSSAVSCSKLENKFASFMFRRSYLCDRPRSYERLTM